MALSEDDHEMIKYHLNELDGSLGGIYRQIGEGLIALSVTVNSCDQQLWRIASALEKLVNVGNKTAGEI